jgi:hypothetical protein
MCFRKLQLKSKVCPHILYVRIRRGFPNVNVTYLYASSATLRACRASYRFDLTRLKQMETEWMRLIGMHHGKEKEHKVSARYQRC